ncbi:MAG: ribonucleoside-triphosphate reductase, partial [Candidatus Paceibacterota bacterium]
GPTEWVETANWIYENWDQVGGLSFLPRFDHVYPLAPYEECDEKTYKELLKRFNGIDFSKIVTYEAQDNTKGAKELACVSGTCEII